MRKRQGKNIIKSFLIGCFLTILYVLAALSINKDVSPYLLLFKETFPLYNQALKMNPLFQFYPAKSGLPDGIIVSIGDEAANEASPVFSSQRSLGGDIREEESFTMIGLDNVIYQPETDMELNHSPYKEALTKQDIDKLKDFKYLKQNFYIVDSRTDLLESDIDVDAFLQQDFSVDLKTSGPKILIFHTHSQEAFIDSRPGVKEDTILGAGAILADLLENQYGIATLHHEGVYDVVDGATQITGAYERMEPAIRKILEENPTIEVIIDMHRDGVKEGTHLVTEINGKQTAQIMFFNGLSRTYKNGTLEELASLPNPYVRDNLSLSFNLQLASNQRYPNFTRKVYINAFRYSLHMMPKTIFVEVGAQTNTTEEIMNAMEPLAELIAEVLKY